MKHCGDCQYINEDKSYCSECDFYVNENTIACGHYHLSQKRLNELLAFPSYIATLRKQAEDSQKARKS
jgi:hypothetical protein